MSFLLFGFQWSFHTDQLQRIISICFVSQIISPQEHEDQLVSHTLMSKLPIGNIHDITFTEQC